MRPDVLRYAAFTTDPAGGNPAGVVLGADELPPDQMQQIAAEVGYSETAFISSVAEDGSARARYFSPEAEVDFCGHATVASAVAIARAGGPRRLRLHTPAGEIAVDVTGEGAQLEATLESVPTRSRPLADDDLTALLALLGWARDDLDPAWPPHLAYAGNEHPILVVRTRERLAGLDYDFAGLRALMTDRGWTTVDLLWPASGTVWHARNPFPVGGVVEDPATGAAAAAFGGYLRAVRPDPGERQVTVLQGEDMGRPSRLTVTLAAGSDRTKVSGAAVEITDAPAAGGSAR